jgi:predicted enzyme related to lactoylglutathione lyase
MISHDMAETERDKSALFKKIDSHQLPVSDLEVALAFYCDALGHELVWRTESGAGLRLPDQTGAEIVLQTERPVAETDLLVESVEDAIERFVAAGGTVVSGPFAIQIGKCAVVRDPFGNVLVIVDMSQGQLITDDEGRILGNEPV